MARAATRGEEAIFGSFFLDGVIDWVGNQFLPADIFHKDELNDWALDNEWIKPADEVPETVFTEEQLAVWAKENGYVKAPTGRLQGYNPPPEGVGPPEKAPPPFPRTLERDLGLP